MYSRTIFASWSFGRECFYARGRVGSTVRSARDDASRASIDGKRATMTLAQAEAFLVLCDELHFGRTAERLFLSQARVSRLIASLEAEVGGALFERTSRRVRITPLGEQLRARIATAIDLLEAGLAETQAAARGATGSLRVGFTRTTHLESLGALIRSFEKRHPECEVVEREVPMVDPYGDLRASEIDVL